MKKPLSLCVCSRAGGRGGRGGRGGGCTAAQTVVLVQRTGDCAAYHQQSGNFVGDVLVLGEVSGNLRNTVTFQGGYILYM